MVTCLSVALGLFVGAGKLAEPVTHDALQAALAQEASGDDAAATLALEAVVRTEPSSSLAHLELGRLLLKQGRNLQGAGYHLDIACALAPENPRGQYLQGLYQEEQGRFAQATRAFEHAVALRPEDAEARSRLASLALRRDDAAGAIEQLEVLKRLQPTQVSVRLLLAQAREKARDIPGAERELVSLRAEHPKAPSTLRALADFYARTHRPLLAERLRREQPGPAQRHLRTLPKSSR